MTMITYLLILLAIFSSYGGSASNTTLQLPMTINPLVQDAIQRGTFTDALIHTDTTFFENVAFSDIVKNLKYYPLPQLQKNLPSLLVLGFAAKNNGLTVDKFEFLQTSKWTIAMSVEELANVSNNITLPLNDQVIFGTIQEAMFKVLEKRFNFKTEEIAEHLNITNDEVYAFLEPGWIEVVNFITEKNILALSRNYTIPPFYVAEALNMSLPELYNSTLPQLEDILVNKIEIIKGLSRLSPTVLSTVGTTSTMAIQPTFITQTETKTSSILNGISSHKEMICTFSKDSSTMVELVSSKSSTDLFQETSSKMMDTSSNMIKMSSTKKSPTSSIVHQLSSMTETSSYTVGELDSKNVTRSTTQTPSLGNTLFSYDMSETIDAMKSAMAETTSVMAISSYPSDVTTSSQFPKHYQTSQSHSSHFVLSTSAKTRKVSTNSRYQQSTSILETSPRFTSTPDDLLSKTIILVKPSSYHATSSMSYAKDNTPNARSGDDVDPVVLVVIPIIFVLILAAISFYICYVDRRKKTTEERAEPESVEKA